MHARYKVVLIGDSGVGKTSIVNRYIKKEFNDLVYTTIAGAGASATIKTENGEVQLEIWDTAGQEQYKSIVGMYFRKASAVILVYDVTNRNSYVNIKSWNDKIKECTSSKIPLFIVGNKIDIQEQRCVNISEARELAERLGSRGYFECSAKTSEGVNFVFEAVAHSPKMTPIEVTSIETVNNTNNRSCC
ncbi:small GTP-binding protein [Tritrichomonas foetus]|uniref:Small GTP-binding protein n=1 Tax=Tritrichomonas foetus TaxID=1144522 RepID=A0A1J4KQR4_9EUKA|nr:small GTP-binding protein [Tritrichomonas foetus]|eukprot:OHT13625.1 small GTP-binding protein [Tritrichomonas foetus]